MIFYQVVSLEIYESKDFIKKGLLKKWVESNTTTDIDGPLY